MSAIMRIVDPTIDKLLDSSGGNLRSLINDALMEMIGDTFRNSKDPEKARKVKVELKLVRLDQQGIFKQFRPHPVSFLTGKILRHTVNLQQVAFDNGKITYFKGMEIQESAKIILPEKDFE